MGISLAVASLLLLSFSSHSFTAAAERSQSSGRRLNVLPGQSIATEIQTAHAAGNLKPRFTLNAAEIIKSSPTNNMFTSTETNLFEVHVREAKPAVTSKTTTSVKGRRSRFVNPDNVATMLVSDEVGVFALIYVDKRAGKVNGIVKKDKTKGVKFTQNGRGEQVRSSMRYVVT